MAFCKCNKPIVQIFVFPERIRDCPSIDAAGLVPIRRKCSTSTKAPAMPHSQFEHIFFIFLLQFDAVRGILTQINTKKEGCRNNLVLRPSFFV